MRGPHLRSDRPRPALHRSPNDWGSESGARNDGAGRADLVVRTRGRCAPVSRCPGRGERRSFISSEQGGTVELAPACREVWSAVEIVVRPEGCRCPAAPTFGFPLPAARSHRSAASSSRSRCSVAGSCSRRRSRRWCGRTSPATPMRTCGTTLSRSARAGM